MIGNVTISIEDMKSYISNLEKNRWNVTQEHIVEI